MRTERITCDRCGYDPHNVAPHEDNGVITHSLSLRHGDRSIDLCGRCFGDFLDWIN